MPCIVFLDEVDGLTRHRQTDDTSFDRRVKTQLIEMVNNFSRETSIFVIGATNMPWDIDPAFLSRSDKKIYFGEYDCEIVSSTLDQIKS